MAMAKKKGLGHGIDAFFSETDKFPEAEAEKTADNAVIEVNISDVEPGDGQPRKSFDSEKINQLAESIKEHGIIQPLIVVKEGKVYKIIAGERRWRAARVAGLKTVPVIEKNVTQRQVVEMALIENIQREDLNPIEEAEAYDRLIHEYSLTQDALAKVVSKSRPAVANTLRLLSLDPEVRKMVAAGELSEGHGRALLGLTRKEDVSKAVKNIVNSGLNVRQTESLVKKINENAEKGAEKPQKEDIADLYQLAVKETEQKLKNKFGTKVKLTDENGKGKIQIEFFSADERERILNMLLDES